MGLFMQDGPRHGQHFGWRRKSGQKNVPNRMRSPAHAASMLFPIGKPNDAFAQYFTGQNYLAPVSADQVGIFNVTFEPGCRNNWHIHHAKSGGGQILICISGRGYYQEWGKKAQELFPGDVVNIPAGVKHWHGATPYRWFSVRECSLLFPYPVYFIPLSMTQMKERG